MVTRNFTAAIYREDDGFVALCPELDVASQGDMLEQARDNLREAVELFLETASKSEIAERLHDKNQDRKSGTGNRSGDFFAGLVSV